MDSQVELTDFADVSFGAMANRINVANQNWPAVAIRLAGAKLGEKEGRIASPEEVAKALGRSKQTVYDWIRAGTMKHVDLDTVKKLSVLAHVSLDDLKRQYKPPKPEPEPTNGQ